MALIGAFRHFGGVTHERLLDNAKPLVKKHNVQTREIVLEVFSRSVGRVKPLAQARDLLPWMIVSIQH